MHVLINSFNRDEGNIPVTSLTNIEGISFPCVISWYYETLLNHLQFTLYMFGSVKNIQNDTVAYHADLVAL